MNTQISSNPHTPDEEYLQDRTWANIIEEMLAGHSETARSIQFKGKPEEVEQAIHSAQVALLRHRTRAIRAGRIRHHIIVIMKRGSKMMVFNRPVENYRKYMHRAAPDIYATLDATVARYRGME